MRRLFAAIIISLAVLVAPVSVSASVTDAQVNTGTYRLISGIVRVSCNSGSDKRLKVMVEKDSKRINYYLKNDGTTESYPLQFGDGNYKVSILENVEGSKYKYISTQHFNLHLENQNVIYLGSVQNINWNRKMEAIRKAGELTENLEGDKEKIAAIYDFVVSNFSYDYEKLKKLSVDYVPDIDSIFKSGKGICYDYASLFAAMLRSVGVPAKLVKGYSVYTDAYHAWNEVYDKEKDKWVVVDTTYDALLKASKMKYSYAKKESDYTKVNEY